MELHNQNMPQAKLIIQKLILVVIILLLLIGIEQYLLCIVGTFLTMIYISNQYKSFPSFFLHYVNPFIFLHLQSFALWSIIEGAVLIDPFIKTYLNISVVAFFTFNIVFLFFVKIDFGKFDQIRVNRYIFAGIKYGSLLALCIYLGFIFTASDLTNKREIKDYIIAINPALGYVYALSNLFMVCVFYELIKHRNNTKKVMRLVLFYGFFFLTIYLILGERDLLFSFGIALFFVLSMKANKFLMRKYYVFIFVVIFIGPYSQLFKSFLKGSASIDLSSKSFAVNGFDDFMTTGYNSFRIYNINKLETVQKNLIVDDIGNVLELTLNSGKWYNRVFLGRETGTTGLGFSLPLTGYLDYKYLGVFIVYGMVGIIIVLFYNNFKGNYIGLAFIIFLISLISYVQRQDLAYVLNFSVKFVFIPYIVLTKIKEKY